MPPYSLAISSSWVINLATDKTAVFREIARVLKLGGRLAVSDIALKWAMPPDLGEDLMVYVRCIAGAIPIEEYRRGLIEAGVAHVEVIDSGAALNAYAKSENQAGGCPPPAAPGVEPGCCSVGPAAVVDEALHARLADLLRRYDMNDYAASVKGFAVKPH